MLKIGTSKVGSVVDCPRCQKSVIVPSQSSHQAEQLYHMLKNKRSERTPVPPPAEDRTLSEPTVPESAWDELGGDVDDADLNRWINELWTTSSASQQETAPAHPTAAPMPNPLPGEEVAILMLQKRLKLMTTLIYVSSTAAFAIGIIFGMSGYALFVQPSRFPQHEAGDSAAPNEIIGTLYYRNQNGERQPDVDAVIICLPKNQPLRQLLPCQGLRPEDEVDHDVVQLIHELGGMYARTDAHGAFAMQYREGERYFVLLISAHQQRSDGEVKPSVMQELRRYFRNPDLFGETCFTTDECEWSGGKYSLRHTFEFVE